MSGTANVDSLQHSNQDVIDTMPNSLWCTGYGATSPALVLPTSLHQSIALTSLLGGGKVFLEHRETVLNALQGHLGRVGEERCAHVRALVVANRALMSRTHLEEQADNWLAESGTLPPGNGVERDLWEVLPFP